ncbi:MAG: hypothetical protein ACE5GJ_06400 [Gemmatimonadota bacterium]
MEIQYTLLNAALGGLDPVFEAYGVEDACVGVAALGPRRSVRRRDAAARRVDLRALTARDRAVAKEILQRLAPWGRGLHPFEACRYSGGGVAVRESSRPAAFISVHAPRWETANMAVVDMTVGYGGNVLTLGFSCRVYREGEGWELGTCNCRGKGRKGDPCVSVW